MIAVSNIAIPPRAPDRDYQLLHDAGVRGIEVAPTRIAEWSALTPLCIEDYRAHLAGLGFRIPSLQAVLFGTKDIQLFGSLQEFENLKSHMNRVADISAALGAQVIVFGSPRQRSRGALSREEALYEGASRFALLGDICKDRGQILAIEPVPALYGGDFLESWVEVEKLVRMVALPSLRVHLDTGCVSLAGDSISAAVLSTRDVLAHFHASQPQLGDFANPITAHRDAGKALRDVLYEGWIAIEMREQGDPVPAILQAVQAVRSAYETD